MTPVRAQVVTVGRPEAGRPPGGDGRPDPLAAAADQVAGALAGAGVVVAACVAVESDPAALLGVLAGAMELTVVLAPAAQVADVLLTVAPGAGTPGAGRAVRWGAPGGEPGWLVEADGRGVGVLPAGAELAALIHDHLVPHARALTAGRPAVLELALRVAGVPAAEVARRLAGWAPGPAVEVRVAPAGGEVVVALRCRADGLEAASRLRDDAAAALAARLGSDCYGAGGDTLERVVGRLLQAQGLTLSVAESCTGGLLGHRITSVPGSSAWFERGVLVYSNRAKQELLGVPEAVLQAHGAVSAPCAEAMARGAAALGASACALAITGIAGPDGGTPAKPVGTVFVGLAVAGAVTSRRFRFTGDRAAIKWESTQAALDLLRRALLDRQAAGGRR